MTHIHLYIDASSFGVCSGSSFWGSFGVPFAVYLGFLLEFLCKFGVLFGFLLIMVTRVFSDTLFPPLSST